MARYEEYAKWAVLEKLASYAKEEECKAWEKRVRYEEYVDWRGSRDYAKYVEWGRQVDELNQAVYEAKVNWDKREPWVSWVF